MEILRSFCDNNQLEFSCLCSFFESFLFKDQKPSPPQSLNKFNFLVSDSAKVIWETASENKLPITHLLSAFFSTKRNLGKQDLDQFLSTFHKLILTTHFIHPEKYFEAINELFGIFEKKNIPKIAKLYCWKLFGTEICNFYQKTQFLGKGSHCFGKLEEQDYSLAQKILIYPIRLSTIEDHKNELFQSQIHQTWEKLFTNFYHSCSLEEDFSSSFAYSLIEGLRTHLGYLDSSDPSILALSTRMFGTIISQIDFHSFRKKKSFKP